MAGLEFGFSFNPQDAPQRHCFYDSDEEEFENGEETSSEGVFTIESLIEVTTIKLLVIGNTQPSCFFLSSHVTTEPEPFAVVKTKCPLKVLKGKYFTRDGDQYESDHGDGLVVSKLYYATNGGTSTCLCLNENAFKEDYCNCWSKTILDHLKPQRVLFLHSLPLLCYFSSESNSDDKYNHHLKGLVTSSWTLDPIADFLPPSNVISGEPAAVMTHCQVSSIPAALAVLYVSNALTPTEQVTCFRPLLLHSLLSSSQSIQTLPEADRLLPSLLPKPRQDLNTLYT